MTDVRGPRDFDAAYEFVERFRTALLATPRHHHLTVDEWLGEALEALAASLSGIVECVGGSRANAAGTRDTLVILAACLQEAACTLDTKERSGLSVKDAARISFELAAQEADKPAGVAPLIVTMLGRVVKARASGPAAPGEISRPELIATALGQALLAAVVVSGGAEHLLQADVPVAPG